MEDNWKPIGALANKAAREIERERLWKKCVDAFENGQFEIAEAYHNKMISMVEVLK